MKCTKCGEQISPRSIIGWLNSASNDLDCSACNKLIVESYFLLPIYLLGGIILVVGISNISTINEIFGVSDFFSMVLIILVGFFIMIGLAFLSAVIKK